MNLTPDFQSLMEVANCTENAQKFNFSFWRGESCGSSCCAIGNYSLEHPEDELKTIYTNYSAGGDVLFRGLRGFEAVAKRFNISEKEALWLFNPASVAAYVSIRGRKYHYIQNFEKKQVAARIRKFIYYKMHKADILLDPKWGIKQSAKEAGHINVAKKVKASLTVA